MTKLPPAVCTCLTRDEIGPGVPRAYATWLVGYFASRCPIKAHHQVHKGRWGVRNTILCGDVRERLRELPDESVHCVVTSPPYWSLRDYGVEATIWGGAAGCEHLWGDEILGGERYTSKKRWQHSSNGENVDKPAISKREEWPDAWEKNAEQGIVCSRCGAWRGALGLEPTPEQYVENIVSVFRDVRRVLRRDGTLWLNLGDSYAGSNGKCKTNHK